MSETTGKLVLTVTVYDGTLEDAAKAFAEMNGTLDVPGGEVEVLAAEVLAARTGEDGRTLTAADPEPPAGTHVRDATGDRWVRSDEGDYWLRVGRDYGDPESWIKVAGNYGPVTVLESPSLIA